MNENEKDSATGRKRRARHGMTRQTLGGFFWTFSGVSVQTVLGIVILAVLARLLEPKDFGVVAAALVVVSFSDIFSRIGIGPALVQRAEITLNHIRTGFTASIIFGLLMSGLVWLLTPVIADLFRMPALKPVLRVFSLIFAVQGVSIVAESLLRRNLRFRWLAGIEAIAYAIGYGAVGVTLALLGFGLWSLVLANLANAFCNTVALLIAQPHARSPQFDRSAFKELVYFGGGFTAARVLNHVALYGDNMVVGRWLGASALGLYERAYTLMKTPTVIYAKIIDRVLFPAMAKIQEDSKRLAVAYRRATALVALIVLPLSVGVSVLAPEIIELLLGRGWTEAVVPFQILAAGMLFRQASRIGSSVTLAKGAVYSAAWRQGVCAAGIVGGAWLGQRVGLSGVAFGVLVATGVYYLLVTQMSLSLLPSLSWKELFIVHLPGVWSSAIIGAQMWGVAEALRAMNLPAILVLIITSAITATLFSALLYLKPSLVLGRDGLWMLQTLIDYLPNKIGNPLRKAFRLKSAVKNSGGPDDADGHEARGAATVPRPNTLD